VNEAGEGESRLAGWPPLLGIPHAAGQYEEGTEPEERGQGAVLETELPSHQASLLLHLKKTMHPESSWPRFPFFCRVRAGSIVLPKHTLWSLALLMFTRSLLSTE
jgi:hypothetical protein